MAGDIKQFVPSGTPLKCSYCSQSGITPVKLMGGNPTISIYGESMMTEKDMVVGTNIVGVFPSCGAPSNVLKTCSPVVTKPWVKNADPQITSNKTELLVNDSYILCDTYFGEISPVMDDPVDITAPKKDEKGKDLPTIENPIDALKEKMNGAVSSVKAKLDGIQEKFGTDLEALLNDVTGPFAKVLNKPGVKSTIEDLQELTGKAQKYKNKADDILNSPEAAKQKMSNKILGTEPEEEKKKEDENENKSLQDRINDGIGGISSEIEAYKQEISNEEDENFVVESLSSILNNMNASLSEFRSYFTDAFKPSESNDTEIDVSNSDTITSEDQESVSDKAKEEYEDIKEYREEYKEYKKEAKAKFDKYSAKLKNAGYDVTGKKNDIIKALMLLNWLEDENAPPKEPQVPTTSGSSDNSKETKTEETTKKAKTTSKKNPSKVRTKINAEVTGYIDGKLLESGINEDIKEAKEDLAGVQKDIDRAKKYLTITSNFNDAIKTLKDAVVGKIGSEVGEEFSKITKKQAYVSNYMTMASSAVEVSKFALSGFATSPGSVVTKVDDGRGKDTDDDPNSDDFGNLASDIHGEGVLGSLIGEGAEGGNNGEETDKPKITDCYYTSDASDRDRITELIDEPKIYLNIITKNMIGKTIDIDITDNKDLGCNLSCSGQPKLQELVFKNYLVEKDHEKIEIDITYS